MQSLNDPLEIIFVVLNFVARFRVPNVDHGGVNKILNFVMRAPTKIMKIGTHENNPLYSIYFAVGQFAPTVATV